MGWALRLNYTFTFTFSKKDASYLITSGQTQMYLTVMIRIPVAFCMFNYRVLRRITEQIKLYFLFEEIVINIGNLKMIAKMCIFSTHLYSYTI